jgi:hypothetical protein
MNQLCAAALAVVLAWSPAFAQQPETRMYPGTDFPGNDLVDVPSGSPEECASRCLADGCCKAFTVQHSQPEVDERGGISGSGGRCRGNLRQSSCHAGNKRNAAVSRSGGSESA